MDHSSDNGELPNAVNGLPVAGYRAQSPEAIATVNALKEMEEHALRLLDEVAADQQLRIDRRWYSIGRTHIEQGFMAVNRSVFKPERVAIVGEPVPAFSGWRLERSDSTPEQPAYFAASKPHGGLSNWTADPELALQFAREEDAEAFARMLGVSVKPVEVMRGGA